MESGSCWPYGVWSFRSEDDALAAIALLRRRIVRPPPDENGEPRAFTAEDFEKSRRLFEEPLPDSEPARDG